MKKTAFATLAVLVALGATGAVAGTPNDDDNDYEGWVSGKKDSTYFGFDLSENGRRVNGVTAYLFYRCEGGEAGSLLVESEGGLRVNNDGEFSGTTTGSSKLDPLTYETTGTLLDDGRAKGTIKAKGKLAPGVTCKARNDGDWRAKEGRDIDYPGMTTR